MIVTHGTEAARAAARDGEENVVTGRDPVVQLLQLLLLLTLLPLLFLTLLPLLFLTLLLKKEGVVRSH